MENQLRPEDLTWLKDAINDIKKSLEKYEKEHKNDISKLETDVKELSDKLLVLSTKLDVAQNQKMNWIAYAAIIISAISVVLQYFKG